MDRIFELIRLWYEGLDGDGDMIRRSRDLPWLRERSSCCSRAATTRWTSSRSRARCARRLRRIA
jgi:hypothetical protein